MTDNKREDNKREDNKREDNKREDNRETDDKVSNIFYGHENKTFRYFGKNI